MAAAASVFSSSSKIKNKEACCLLDFLHDDNILLQILERLPDGFDRRNFRLVCKSFWLLECFSRRRLQLLRAELLLPALKRLSNLRELDLSLCAGVSDENLIQVADAAGGNLSSVCLNRVAGFSNAGLFYLALHCASLVDLDVSYCPSVGDAGLFGLAQNRRCKLEKLKLTGCFRLTDLGLEFVAAGCARLRSLVLKGCVGVTDAGLRQVAACCKELTLLDLSFMEITDEGVGFVADLEALQTLKLTACNNVRDKAMEHLQTKCKSLVELDVSRCQNLTTVAVRAFPSLLYLNLSQCSQISEDALGQFRSFNKLQSLRLDAIEITEDGLDHVATGCKQLREFSLSKSRGVTDRRIASLIQTFKGLNRLDLTCCFELTEISLLSIAANCRGLKILKMESSPMVTDQSLCLVLQNCVSLEELNVTECNVTDAGLVSIGNCRSLRVLKLAFCNTTNAGISCVGAACRNLTELDLYRCRAVGDIGVASIVSGCENLQVLNLSYCSRITDASMREISRLSKLCQLEIRGCNLITSDGLTHVAAGCKRLVELDIKRCTRIDDPGVAALESLCPDLRQINVSYCPLTNNGMMALSKLGCLQNMKLIHLRNVSMDCFGNALVKCGSLRKVKLLSHVKHSLPSGVVEELERRGCRLRWMDKPIA